MSVATLLNMKVFVDKTRWKTMLCYDWPISMQARLTTDPNASTLWVVPLNQVNFQNLGNLLQKRKDCNRVVAFQPTGWTHSAKPAANDNGVLTPRVKGNITIYSVAYSEHSSFSELVNFITLFRYEHFPDSSSSAIHRTSKFYVIILRTISLLSLGRHW